MVSQTVVDVSLVVHRSLFTSTEH